MRIHRKYSGLKIKKLATLQTSKRSNGAITHTIQGFAVRVTCRAHIVEIVQNPGFLNHGNSMDYERPVLPLR